MKNFTDISPLEDGKTFEENALIKAKFAQKVSNNSLPIISDDSGLCIKNLGNNPGIFSSRWALNNDYNFAFDKIYSKFNKLYINPNGQVARFVCVLIFIKNNKISKYKGDLEGTLSFPPKGKNGFGYDPIFRPKNESRTLAQLSPNFKNSFSHRKKAIDKLWKDNFIL